MGPHGVMLDMPANTVDLHVVNSSGMRVYSTEGETGAGVRHSVEWDALDKGSRGARSLQTVSDRQGRTGKYY